MSKLYLSASPAGQVAEISGGVFSIFASNLAFPSAVETSADGTLYTSEGIANRITSFPGGTEPRRELRELWMNFHLDTDLTFDDATGTLYVNNSLGGSAAKGPLLGLLIAHECAGRVTAQTTPPI